VSTGCRTRIDLSLLCDHAVFAMIVMTTKKARLNPTILKNGFMIF